MNLNMRSDPQSDVVNHLSLRIPSPRNNSDFGNSLYDNNNDDGETKQGSNMTIILNIPNVEDNENNAQSTLSKTSNCCMGRYGRTEEQSSNIDKIENKFSSTDLFGRKGFFEKRFCSKGLFSSRSSL